MVLFYFSPRSPNKKLFETPDPKEEVLFLSNIRICHQWLLHRCWKMFSAEWSHGFQILQIPDFSSSPSGREVAQISFLSKKIKQKLWSHFKRKNGRLKQSNNAAWEGKLYKDISNCTEHIKIITFYFFLGFGKSRLSPEQQNKWNLVSYVCSAWN